MKNKMLLALEKAILAFTVIYLNYTVGSILYEAVMAAFAGTDELLKTMSEPQVRQQKYFIFGTLGAIILGLLSCTIWSTLYFMKRTRSIFSRKKEKKEPIDKK